MRSEWTTQRPEPAGDGARIVSNCLAFFRGLRRMGLRIGTPEILLALEAMAHLPLEDESALRDGWRAVLAHNRSEAELFDLAWRQFGFLLIGIREPLVATQTLLASVARLRASWRHTPQVVWLGAGDREPGEERNEVPLVVRGGQSAAEMLRHQDAVRLTPEEIRQLESAVLSPLWRRSRRRKPARKGKEWDGSATLRRAVQRGECWELARRRRVARKRRTVWICDVSGSMDPYSRMVLRFVYALARRGIPVEVFVCSTRLTRVTPALANRDADRALSDMVSAAPDWSGGTRLARALQTLRLEWGRRIVRGAGLILVTDGLEAEDPGSLGEEIQKLRKLAAWTVWLNPALSDPEYRPVAKGSAVLHEAVDAHWPGYSWGCLESAWRQLEQKENVGRVGGRR